MVAPGQLSDFTSFIAVMVILDVLIKIFRIQNRVSRRHAADTLGPMLKLGFLGIPAVIFGSVLVFVVFDDFTNRIHLSSVLGQVFPIVRHYDGVFSNAVRVWLALNCLMAVVLQVIIAAKVGTFTQDVKIQDQIEPTLSTWIFFFSPFIGSFFMYFGWWGIAIDIQTSSSVVFNMNFNESLRPYLSLRYDYCSTTVYLRHARCIL